VHVGSTPLALWHNIVGLCSAVQLVLSSCAAAWLELYGKCWRVVDGFAMSQAVAEDRTSALPQAYYASKRL
jgi:hypothetical protein